MRTFEIRRGVGGIQGATREAGDVVSVGLALHKIRPWALLLSLSCSLPKLGWLPSEPTRAPGTLVELSRSPSL